MPARPDARSAVLATVSESTARRLEIYADLLERWQRSINLVAASTLPDVWTRHIADSLQVSAAVPDARRWVDFGSGGGLPGMVTAICLAEEPGASVHLVESDRRKAAFLRTVSRETGAAATVHAERIESFVTAHAAPVDAISARALAPLSQLLAYAAPFLAKGAVGVFPKGQSVETELTGLASANKFHIESRPSRTDPAARLLIVRAI